MDVAEPEPMATDGLDQPVAEPMQDEEPLIESLAPEDPEPMEGVVGVAEIGPAPEKPEEDPLQGDWLWVVPNFSSLPHKHLSEDVTLGGYPWRILMFPSGNKMDSISLYLDVADSDSLGEVWSRRASFTLTLVNQLDASRNIVKDASHTFNPQGQDWGFTQFLPLAELRDPTKGYLVDDTVQIKLSVKVEKLDRFDYDSKKETGYVGLKNQGATCYMSSLLQSLYNLNYFRQAVYHMPTAEEDEPAKSIPLALQSLFYKLQFGESSVATKDLTKSFGWDNYEAFMQHDVQELNRVLCEKLEEKMKGTKVEGTMTKLFEGHMHNFIECTEVEYKSTRQESFMDLQLDVKGCKNIYDSFDKYTEIELMNGQNQYNADGHGLQDAKKGVLFDDFPPVLQLQLKRFEYDFQRDVMVKINDRYEFTEELDLDVGEGKYLSASADRAVRNKYLLHSVLVHSGGVHGGHYYAYIRPDKEQWLKFDDERVSKEEKRKALDEQFGGEDENLPPAPGYNAPTFKFTKYSNAYMLVYVRESEWDSIMRDVTEEDIALHVRTRLQKEHEEKERKKKEKLEAHLYTVIRLARDEDLKEQIGNGRWFDLVDHDKVKQFRVKKQTVFNDFKLQVAEELGIPVEKQRYWVWAKRQNGTFRPSRPLTEEEESMKLADIRDPLTQHVKLGNQADLKLYLEIPSSPSQGLHQRSKHELFLFFKYYDPDTQILSFAGRCYAHKNTKVVDLFPIMRKFAGLEESADLVVFEEIKFEPKVMCNQLDRRSTLVSFELEDGDIICFQRSGPKPEADGEGEAMVAADRAEPAYPSVIDFFQYVKNRQIVVFKKLENPKEDGKELELSKEMTYEEVTAALAAALEVDDPQKLRLTQHNCYSQAPKPSHIHWPGLASLNDMLLHYNQLSNILYYEVLDLPLQEIERLKFLQVKFHNEKGEEVSSHNVRLPKESLVEDVISELEISLGDAVLRGRPLRLLEVYFYKIYKVFDPKDKIDTINDQYWNIRAEVIPEEEDNLGPGDRLLHAYHMTVDSHNHVTNFGEPIFLRVNEDESLAQVKERLQAKLGVADEEFAKWKFAFMRSSVTQPDYLEDQDVVLTKFARPAPGYGNNGETNYLGMEHVDTKPRRNHHSNSRTQLERPVKIYN